MNPDHPALLLIYPCVVDYTVCGTNPNVETTEHQQLPSAKDVLRCLHKLCVIRSATVVWWDLAWTTNFIPARFVLNALELFGLDFCTW